MGIFDNDGLWPTPGPVAERMLTPYAELLAGQTYVLDPSAGKGDLLDKVKECAKRPRYYGSHSAKEVYYEHNDWIKLYAVEIDPNLRAALEDKGYPVMGQDFMTYQPTLNFDLIVMNPPWIDAERHLMHAWQILKAGDIACIVPTHVFEDDKDVYASTIRGLVADHGSVEHLGPAFKAAERPTDVNVSIVRLHKDRDIPDMEFDVKNDQEFPHFDEEERNTEVALNDYIGAKLAFYNAALGAWEDYHRARVRMAKYLKGLDPYKNDDLLKLAGEKTYNLFAEGITQAAWNQVFEHPGFRKVLTARTRSMLAEFQRKQQHIDFNQYNIEGFLAFVVTMRDEILKGAVLDAFDSLTKYHQDNTEHWEGWKTNNATRVRKKIIVPYIINWRPFRWQGKDTGSLEVSYDDSGQYTDIDRALCFVTGYDFDGCRTILETLRDALRIYGDKVGGETESTFFNIRYYKKGTTHLTFREDWVWEAFNLAVARAHNWLPAEVDHSQNYDGQEAQYAARRAKRAAEAAEYAEGEFEQVPLFE